MHNDSIHSPSEAAPRTGSYTSRRSSRRRREMSTPARTPAQMTKARVQAACGAEPEAAFCGSVRDGEWREIKARAR
jgi:hypothetical protein